MPNPPNPYDFVPFEPNPPKRHCPPQTQGTFDSNLFTGELVCLLHTETPLFIHRQQGGNPSAPRQFYQRKGQIVIPASSLKGMVRSVAEAVSNSCLRVLGQKGFIGNSGERIYEFPNKPRFQIFPEENRPKSLPSNSGIIPKGYGACENKDNLCFCCALFGMTEASIEGEEKAAPLAGRVRFTEGVPQSTLNQVSINLPIGGSPRVWHSSFYFDANRKLLGRKFYYHQPFSQQTINRLYNDIPPHRWITVQAQTGDFIFTVRFHNLREDELAVLVYSLMLEDDLRHHLGYGKPFGLGSVKITINEMQLMHFDDGKPSRYLDYEETPSIPAWRVESPTTWLSKGKQQWTGRNGAQTAYNKFKAILKYPQTLSFRYPTFQWFRHSPNRSATLAQYQSNPNVRT